MGDLKSWLKKHMPPSSKTVNERLDGIERILKRIDKDSDPNLFYLMCKANEVQSVHEKTFLPYKGIHQGKEIVIVGTGPSLNCYEPIKDAIHMGANSAYKNAICKMDYMFFQDFEAEGEAFSIEEIKELKCEKFVGNYIKKVQNTAMCAPQYAAEYMGAKPYFVYDYFPGPGRINRYRIPVNLEFYPLTDNCSTIFAVMQFALYTHPKRIYIVGCDCSYALGRHFDKSNAGIPMQLDTVYKNWILMKEHMEIYYPDVEVVSVNPIGLKGLFCDIYTDAFLRTSDEA